MPLSLTLSEYTLQALRQQCGLEFGDLTDTFGAHVPFLSAPNK